MIYRYVDYCFSYLFFLFILFFFFVGKGFFPNQIETRKEQATKRWKEKERERLGKTKEEEEREEREEKEKRMGILGCEGGGDWGVFLLDLMVYEIDAILGLFLYFFISLFLEHYSNPNSPQRLIQNEALRQMAQQLFLSFSSSTKSSKTLFFSPPLSLILTQ